MSPGEKRNATRQGGAPLKTYDTRNVAQQSEVGELFPELVTKLEAAGVEHVFRPSSRDLITLCPQCTGKLVLDVTKPFWMCLSPGKCSVEAMTFEAVVSAVIGRARQ